MKKTLLVGALTAATISLSSCGLVPGTSMETIEPGYTGMKIDLYGDSKGIDNAQLVNGRVWYNSYTEQVVSFPTFTTTYPFTKSVQEGNAKDESIRFSVGGTPVIADVGLSFSFLPDKLKEYYKTYRKTPEAFLASDLRNGLRSCLGRASEELKLTPPAIPTNQDKLMNTAEECLQAKFPMVNITGVNLLASIDLPDQVQKAIDEQYSSQQAATTAEFNKKKVEAEAKAKLAQAQSEAAVTVAAAQAQAEANRKLAESVTPQLLELKRLEVEQARVQKWSGNYGTIIQTPNAQIGTQTSAK